MSEYSYLLSFRLSNSEDKGNYNKRRDALLTKFDAKSAFDTDEKEKENENETATNKDNENKTKLTTNNEDKTEPTTSTIIWESNDYIDSVIKKIQDILKSKDIALLIFCVEGKLEKVVRIMPKKYITYSSINK